MDGSSAGRQRPDWRDGVWRNRRRAAADQRRHSLGGVPHDYTNPDARVHLDEIRKLIFAGNLDEAEKLSSTMMGTPKLLMPYQPFCNLRLHFPGHAQTTQCAPASS